jgi:BioD-like phosphotransacetylase family protein
MGVPKHLLVGSTRGGSGKSAVILGLGLHLQKRGLVVGYGKPLGTFTSRELPQDAQPIEADVQFITQALRLPPPLIRPTLLCLDRHSLESQLKEQKDYSAQLRQYHTMTAGDIVLVEAPANTAEGAIFGLSLRQMAEALEAPILLVVRHSDLLVADHLLVARERMGKHLMGVVINDIPPQSLDFARSVLTPYLESRGIAVLSVMPESRILRSISVLSLVEELGATVLYAPDTIGLGEILVEDLKIGAMDVNSAQVFFRSAPQKAVVTGSSRVDLQMAALESSTVCLILTGTPQITPEVKQRAAEFEVPVLAVSQDTLTTVEIIRDCLGQVRLQEGLKVKCIVELLEQYFDFDRFLELMDLPKS